VSSDSEQKAPDLRPVESIEPDDPASVDVVNETKYTAQAAYVAGEQRVGLDRRSAGQDLDTRWLEERQREVLRSDQVDPS
jgi:hypothetical protein